MWAAFAGAYVAVGLVIGTDRAERFGPMAWVTGAYVIFTPVLALVLGRYGAKSAWTLLSLRWILAQTPILMMFVARFDRAPRWLYGPVVLGTVVSMIVAQRDALRSIAAGTPR